MKTVYTKSELENALSSGEKHLLLKGELAKAISKKNKRRKIAKGGGIALVVGGILTAIPTGGVSLGATAIGLTVGGVTITATELAILFGGSAVILAVVKGRGVKLKKMDKEGNTWEMDIEGAPKS